MNSRKKQDGLMAQRSAGLGKLILPLGKHCKGLHRMKDVNGEIQRLNRGKPEDDCRGAEDLL